MAASVPQQKIDDCRGLYVQFGGLDHDRIVAEMRAKGWTSFTKRNLYARTRGGRVTPGWPERFGWDGELFAAEARGRFTAETRRRREERANSKRSRNASGLPGGLTADPKFSQRLSVSAVKNKPGKPGTAYASRRTFAREHTPLPKAAMLAPEPPKFKRQKMRRLRKNELSTAETQRRGEATENWPQINAEGADRPQGHVIVPDLRHLRHLRPAAADDEAKSPAPRLSDSAVRTPETADFHAWLKTLPGVWGWDYRHQHYLYERLQRVTDGSCKRLMIFMPPRHGKSEMVTVRYTAWRLKQDPSMNVILGSYNQSLANRFSRKIKKVLIDDHEVTTGGAQPAAAGNAGASGGTAATAAGGLRHQSTSASRRASAGGTGGTGEGACAPGLSPFPFTRARPINTVSEWETTAGGGLRSVGVGSGVTGYGAHLIVIDDPVKSREQASSERFREKVWDWYNDDLYTRLEPGGSIILIQTRWHEDDLAGRLLKAMADGGEQWEVVALPALAEAAPPISNDEYRISNEEVPVLSPDILNSKFDIRNSPDPLGRSPGDPLWPDRYPIAELDRIRATMSEVSFASLYQQRPVPREGGVFKRAWFKQIVDHVPQGLMWKRGYDLAISLKETADYTASFRVAYDSEGYLYIDGGFRRRIDFPQQRRYMVERMNLERDTEHGIEQVNHGYSFVQQLRKEPELRGRKFRGVAIKGDKHQRALPWISLAEEGRIRLTRGPWNKQFIEEACSFPFGAHDDQIDAVSIAVSMHERKSSKLYVF